MKTLQLKHLNPVGHTIDNLFHACMGVIKLKTWISFEKVPATNKIEEIREITRRKDANNLAQ